MSWLNDLKEKVVDAKAYIENEVKKFNNEKFSNGAMSIMALVAYADRKITVEEIEKMGRVISSNSMLKCFDPKKLKETFTKYCSKLESDFDT